MIVVQLFIIIVETLGFKHLQFLRVKLIVKRYLMYL